MSGEDRGPLGFTLPAELQWVPPERKPPTEAQRAAYEKDLENRSAMGAAFGSGFDVGEEMARVGLKTSAQLAEEQAHAERLAALTADESRVDAEHETRIAQAKADAKLGKKIAKLGKKIAKAKAAVEAPSDPEKEGG